MVDSYSDSIIISTKIHSVNSYSRYITKFPKCYLFLDKAPQHYTSNKVRKYFEEHRDSLIPVWLPTASPEFMVLEECWNISKIDLLVLTYYKSFTEFRTRLGNYFRTRRFNLDMRNYLTKVMSRDLS